jgi:hypothetical protein
MIGFVPGERLSATRDGPVLVVELPPEAPLLAECARGPARVEVTVTMA